MKKDNMIKMVLVLILVGIFMLQYAGMLFQPNSGETPTGQVEQYVGTAVVNATIDYYERTLYVDQMDYETESLVLEMEGVKEIVNEGEVKKISVNKKEEVVPLYYELKEIGILSYGIAKVTLQPSVTMYEEGNTPITGYFYNRKIKIAGIEPVFPEDSIIQIQTEVVIQEEQAFQVGEMQLYFYSKEITGIALILDKSHVSEFIIPWENRNEIDLETLYMGYGEENITYEQNNQILFFEPLSIEEQIAKKFEYVNYITENLATINEEFNDVEQIKEDFGENTLLMNSTLVVVGEEVQLEFSSNEYDIYTIELNISEDYILREELKQQYLNYEGEIEGEIEVNINTAITGNNIITIEGISVITLP